VPPLHSTGNMRAPSPDAGLIQRSLSSKCVAGAGRSAEAYAPLQVPQATVCSIQPGIQVSAPCLPRTLQQTGSYADVTNVIPPGVCGASTPTVQEPQSRPRSPSPPAIQGENTFNDVQAVYARSLRERDDEIVRLKEQVRIVSLTPKLSPSSGDATAGRRRLFEENIKLKRDVAQLQDALKGQPEQTCDEPTVRAACANSRPLGGGAADRVADGEANPCGEDTTPPLEDSVAVISDGSCATCMTAVEPQRGFPSRSPRSSWTARVMQLQRQLKEKEDDAKCMEESLCAKIHRLEARLEQLQMQREQHQQVFLGEEEHPVPVEEISGRDADLTCRVETDVGMDGQDDRPVTVIRRALCGHQEKPKHCVDHPLAARRERQRLEEEVRRMEFEASQLWEKLRHEREQWRQEREGMLADQRRRERAEEGLRRQLASVQDRLDMVQLGETEREQERRQLRSQVQQLSEKSKAESDEREAEFVRKNEELEQQARSQDLEIVRLRREVQQLENERAQHTRLAARHRHQSPPPRVPSAAEERPSLARRGGSSVAGRGGGRSTCGVAFGLARRGGAPSCTGGRGALSLVGSAPGVSQANTACHAGGAGSTGLAPSVGEGRSGSAVRSASSSTFTSSSDESSTGSSSAATPRRKRNSQLCAVFGDSPLQLVPGVGWYFLLRINSTKHGWVGGFGIGVTLSKPSALECLPDRAKCVPQSWLAGYWGRTFSNGHERLSDWKPQALRAGDEVGFLVTLDGVCHVCINSEERCRFSDPPVPVVGKAGMADLELTPLIDVSVAAASVTFLDDSPMSIPGTREVRDGPGISAGKNTSSPSAAQALTTPAMAAVVGKVGSSPPPPPPSPKTATGSPQQPRLNSSPGGAKPQRAGGNSPSPPVPPLLPLRSSLTSPMQPSPAAAAAAAAARRVPQLALPVR